MAVELCRAYLAPGIWYIMWYNVRASGTSYELVCTSTGYLVVSIWRCLIVGRIARMNSSWYGAQTQTMEQKLSDECFVQQVYRIAAVPYAYVKQARYGDKISSTR